MYFFKKSSVSGKSITRLGAIKVFEEYFGKNIDITVIITNLKSKKIFFLLE